MSGGDQGHPVPRGGAPQDPDDAGGEQAAAHAAVAVHQGLAGAARDRSATEADLRNAFEKHGEVSRVNIPTDRETAQPRGFGFIEMPKANEAQAAMTALNGTELNGRQISVNEARPKGEGGAIPVTALFVQAVENALNIPGLELLEIPLNPSKLWQTVTLVK